MGARGASDAAFDEGVFQQNFTPIGSEKLTPVTEIQLAESDVISFHNYSWPEDFEKHVIGLQKHNRPLICTEYWRIGGKNVRYDSADCQEVSRCGHQLGFVDGKSQ